MIRVKLYTIPTRPICEGVDLENVITETFFSHSLMNSYIFLTLCLFSFSVYCVIIPLNRLRIEYGFSVKNRRESKKKKRDIIKFLSGPEQSEKNLKKIRLFLLKEILISILPLLTVILIRLYLGRPDDINYDFTNMMLIMIFYTIWLYYNIVSSIRFRNMIIPYIPSMQKKFIDKRHHPKYLFAMLNFSNISRAKINSLSKMEIPDYVESKEFEMKPMNLIDTNKKVDSTAILENLSAIGSKVVDTVTNLAIEGKKLTKTGMKLADEQINAYVSKRVETWTNQDNRWLSSLVQIVNVVFPIVLIYLFSIIW